MLFMLMFITLQIKLKIRWTCLGLTYNSKIQIEIYFLSPKALKCVLLYCSNYIEQCFKRFYKDCPRQIPHRWIPSWSIPTGWIPTLSNSYLMNSHLVNSHPVIFHSVNFSLETTFPVKNGQENKLKLSAFTMTFCFANGIFLTSLRVLIVVNYPM